MNVGIIGYFGHRNFGDDLFLASVLEGLAPLPSSTQIRVWATRLPDQPEFRGAKALLSRNRIFNRLTWKSRAAKGLGASDILLFAGGSNFRNTKVMEKFALILEYARNAKVLGAGISVGPFEDVKAKATCAALLSKFHEIRVRDAVSLQRCNDLGVKAQLGWDIGAAWLANRRCTKEGYGDKLGISLANIWGREGVRTIRKIGILDQMAATVKGLIDQGVFSGVRLLSLCGDRIYDDRPILNELAARLEGACPIEFFDYQERLEDARNAILDCKAMIAMRLHGAVVAHSLGVPFVLVAYQEKALAWASLVGLAEDRYVDWTELGSPRLGKCLVDCLGSQGGPIVHSLDGVSLARTEIIRLVESIKQVGKL